MLVTSKNDSDKQIKEIVDFVKEELGPEVPLHFSRYFPQYKLDLPPTPLERLRRAREIALKAGLHYVYLGNIRDAEHSNTFCKNCGELLINRIGYYTRIVNLTDEGLCKNCQTDNNLVLQ